MSQIELLGTDAGETMQPRSHKKLRSRLKSQSVRGFSLLEMVFATALMAGTLVPALAVMRDSMAKSREMNHRNVLSIAANYNMEFSVATAAGNWALASNYTFSGPYTSPDGYANIRYSVSMTDDPANGGITNQLSHVQVTAFDDLNQNTTLDVNEPSVSYRTKVAKLQSYENLPE